MRYRLRYDTRQSRDAWLVLVLAVFKYVGAPFFVGQTENGGLRLLTRIPMLSNVFDTMIHFGFELLLIRMPFSYRIWAMMFVTVIWTKTRQLNWRQQRFLRANPTTEDGIV